jgi:hypothetical protein
MEKNEKIVAKFLFKAVHEIQTVVQLVVDAITNRPFRMSVQQA